MTRSHVSKSQSICHVCDVPKPSLPGRRHLSLTTPAPRKIKSRLLGSCKALLSLILVCLFESLTHFFSEQLNHLGLPEETTLYVFSAWNPVCSSD